MSILARSRQKVKEGLVLVGLGCSVYGLGEYNEYQRVTTTRTDNGNGNGNDNGNDNGTSTDGGKKKILHLPFHKMKIVERKKASASISILTDLLFSSNANDDNDKLQEVELKTIIDTIHQAAKDPEVVALCATFGNGFRFQSGGYAHIEEIRNAITVFNQSHRRHYDPSYQYPHTGGMATGTKKHKDTRKHELDSLDEGNKILTTSTSVTKNMSTSTSTNTNTNTSTCNTKNKNQNNTHYEKENDKYFYNQRNSNSNRLNNNNNRLNNNNNRLNNNNNNLHVPPQKFSYAFADTFDHPVDSANKEYFLASSFSYVLMQPRGNLNLFGVSTSNSFFLGTLQKYGIKAHVFKHGQYKNAPNAFTEYGYTKAHLENTKSIVQSINNTILSSITMSRNLHDTYNNKIWQAIHDYGTLSASNAQQIKLIDQLPRIDPFSELVVLNKNKHSQHNERIQYLRKSWTWLMNEHQFNANTMESFQQYTKLLEIRNKWMKRKYALNKILTNAANKSYAMESLLSVFGLQAPYFNINQKDYDPDYNQNQKIAVVYITGAIDNAKATTVTKCFQKIKYDKNIKAVICRIDSPGGSVTASETILEECKDINKPVICSFSNMAASGGYYVSAFSDRIFALPTTLTGSIGVFGIKFDATDLAKSYGVEVNFVSSGKHALTNSAMHPLTRQMKSNIERGMSKVYSYFKEIVSEGRGIPLKEVETIARGRVWTGVQAKEVRLVDEIGGLERAILYAKRKYTKNGSAQVEVWPKPLSWKDKIVRNMSQDEAEKITSDVECDTFANLAQLVLNGTISPSILLSKLPEASRLLFAIDESTAVQFAIQDALKRFP